MSNKILNLDLSKDPIMPAIVYGRVGDDRLQTVTVNVARRDEVADLTGYDITFEGTTYNGQTKVFDSNNVSSNASELKKGTFDYTFPNMAFAVAGKYEQAYFSIVKDGKRDSTAGFEIYVDGNADIDAPEAETIITEYNKLVAELNKLQNEAIDEMDQNFTVAQERIVELEGQISDLRSQIEQALADFETGNFWTKEESFNKEQSSANVVDQVIGKESNIEATSLDFKDKVSGSLVENVNKIASTQYTSLLPPSNGTWLEFPQADIDKVKALDKELFLRNEKANGYMQQVLICYDVLAYLINRLGENFFTDRGAKEVSSQVTVIRSMISGIAGNVWGYGSGPNGNKMTFQVWTPVRNKWEGSLTTTNSTVTKIKRSVGSTNEFIDSTGKMYFLVNAEPGDGVTASTLNIDYVSLQFDLNVSANDYIKSMMAAYCGEKESGTWIQKEQSLGADEDMNDFNEIGTYTVSYNHRINQPANIGSQQGWLTVYQASPTSSVVSQEVIYPNAGASKGGARMFARNLLNKNTNLWGDWQEITKLFASQLEVINGTSDDKMISPKTLADTIKFKEVFKEGIALSNVANEGTLVPHGDSVGGSLNHVNNRPYTVNSDGSFTFKRATNLLVTGGMKLVVGDTNPTDYLHVNAYVNNALNEFIALGATAATNGTLRLTWSAMGQRVISVNSGDVLSLKIGLRSGKQAFAVQLTSLKIEEV
ncbi:BppU family phage baseplate upper protein [Enterococcus malodoratus]|uniref:BppU N-terminal domain-containing protein n=1 Tax=Enterococcus malodoratus ATCC 43197 TaxID=1158601 RepID=R2S406_9ENTE|nr:BppU family phage baseplate upper protein [Enterococcus malodoratus]EOH82874.1 hypothetical protein UAI_00060 [Enterococcus malodoratus ATCC 43197]EOT69678.1 hypothetical protein I585_01145 [Enterococcus malodoratus ATCC 43197]OJG57421.1 hypothetical protein RV07_GL003380 [Enterococcus malodoratus]SPX01317.1 Uncharacterised protein [Enterococcus malodoratus]STC70969.1 Uncharacterised protein [Enterococcus malodoratus]